MSLHLSFFKAICLLWLLGGLCFQNIQAQQCYANTAHILYDNQETGPGTGPNYRHRWWVKNYASCLGNNFKVEMADIYRSNGSGWTPFSQAGFTHVSTPRFNLGGYGGTGIAECTYTFNPGQTGTYRIYFDLLDQYNSFVPRLCGTYPGECRLFSEVVINTLPQPNLTYNSSYNSLSVNGTTISVNMRAINNGSAHAGSSSWVAYYLSPDQTIETNDYYLGNDNCGTLAAGGGSNESLSNFDVTSVSPTIPPGWYYVGYLVDYSGNVSESNENDNSYCFTSSSQRVYIPQPQPNLTYNNSYNSLTVNGTSISVNMRAINNGSGVAGSSRLAYYLSPDQTITPGDYYLDDDYVPGLSTGGGSSESLPNFDVTTVSPTIPSGWYYVGYIIDYQGNVSESNENDNTYCFSSSSQRVYIPPQQPNLTYDNPSNSLTVSGTSITVNMQVINNGSGVAGSSRLGYYLSTDQTITAADYYLDDDYVPSLSAGNGSSEGLPNFDVTTVTPTIPSGWYYVGYIIDYQGNVSESNENDNTYCFSSSSQRVYIPPQQPNLTYDNLSNSLTVNGTIITVGMQVINDGSAAAGSSQLGYYLSDDQIITTADNYLDVDLVPGLSAGNGSPQSLSNFDVTTVSPTIPSGWYYVGYIVDYQGNVSESNENDNTYCFSATSQRVFIPPAQPNLTFQSAANLLSINNTMVTIDLTVENNGSGNAGANQVGFYISTDAIITTGDYVLGNDPLGILTPNATETSSFSVDVTTVVPTIPPGWYYVGYYIDDQSSIGETNESDNSFSFPVTQRVYIPAPLPNLTYVGTANTLTTSGTNVNVAVEVINNGPGNASASQISFFASTDAQISASDFLLGSNSLPALISGASSQQTYAGDLANTTLSPGCYYIGYIIDDQGGVTESDETDNTFGFVQQACIPQTPTQTCSGCTELVSTHTLPRNGAIHVARSTLFQWEFESGRSLDSYVLEIDQDNNGNWVGPISINGNLSNTIPTPATGATVEFSINSTADLTYGGTYRWRVTGYDIASNPVGCFEKTFRVMDAPVVASGLPINNCPASCGSGTPSGSTAAFGTALGHLDNVVIYKNGYCNNGCYDKFMGPVTTIPLRYDTRHQPGYLYGFQCVEYVRRYYEERWDLNIGRGNGKDFIKLENERKGFRQFKNGTSEVPPQNGDIISFPSPYWSNYGHVGIVKEVIPAISQGVSQYTLVFSSENLGNDGSQHLAMSLPMVRDGNGRYTVFGRVLGWIRPLPELVAPGAERGFPLVNTAEPTFEWTEHTFATDYKLYIAEKNGNCYTALPGMPFGIPAGQSTFSGLPALTPGKFYKWRVEVMFPSGQSAFSAPFYFQVDPNAATGLSSAAQLATIPTIQFPIKTLGSEVAGAEVSFKTPLGWLPIGMTDEKGGVILETSSPFYPGDSLRVKAHGYKPILLAVNNSMLDRGALYIPMIEDPLANGLLRPVLELQTLH